MKKIAMIPARYAATRFPGKLMQKLGNATVIQHTYQNTLNTQLFDSVVVVTDSELIYNEIVSNGGNAIMSKETHESGSDRIAEAARDLDVDIIVNVQGDEPFVNATATQRLLACFEDPTVQVASLMQVLTDEALIADPNYVKVITNEKMDALYFSRSPIPFRMDTTIKASFYEHIGIYAFKKQALLLFSGWERTPLEKIEKIECLRYLEKGIPIRMAIAEYIGVEIDTPEDLVRAHNLQLGITG